MTREEAINQLQDAKDGYQEYLSAEIIDMAIKALEQEPKTGHWIEHEQNGIAHIECSECSTWFLRCHLLRNTYCPNCGAKMVEPQE